MLPGYGPGARGERQRVGQLLKPVSKRKQGRTLGAVEIIRRENYADLELDATVELICSLVFLGLMHVEDLLDEEVTALAGVRYATAHFQSERDRQGKDNLDLFPSEVIGKTGPVRCRVRLDGLLKFNHRADA